MTTCRWLSTARLGMALHDRGLTVEAVCPTEHPLEKTSAFATAHPFRALRPIASFSQAIKRSGADLVIPCDEGAVLHLHRLFADAPCHRGIIERSLGAGSRFPTVASRTAFLQLAKARGVRVPETQTIASFDQLERWIDVRGVPAVLKVDGSSGGEGVQIVASREGARHTFARLRAPMESYKVWKRALVDRDPNYVLPWIRRAPRSVSIQSYVPGRDANIALFAWRGEVLASVTVEVLQTCRERGPAAVVRRIEYPAITGAAQKVVAALGLSGFCGMDFMIEPGTGNCYLIELNARATQTAHLAFAGKVDIAGAVASVLTGVTASPGTQGILGDTVALFPAAWQLDPRGEVLRTAYHDVPWEEPELVQEAMVPPSPINYENWMAWKQRWLGHSRLPDKGMAA